MSGYKGFPHRYTWLLLRLSWLPAQLFGVALLFSLVFQVQIETTIQAEITEQVSLATLSLPLSQMPEGPAAFRKKLRASLEKSWGLDQPILLRILRRSIDLLTFNLGRSRSESTKSRPSSTQVSAVIGEYLVPSLQLYVLGGALSITLGLILGFQAAWNRRSPLDKALDILCPFLGASPSWWLAMLLIMVFVFAVPILPYGRGEPLIVLPLIALVLARTGSFAFLARTCARMVLGEDWVDALRARGFSTRRILYGHVLKACSGPLITMGSMQVLGIMSTEFILERITLYPGLGTLLSKALMGNDFALAGGILMTFSYIYVLTMLLLDVSYGILDPRVGERRISA